VLYACHKGGGRESQTSSASGFCYSLRVIQCTSFCELHHPLILEMCSSSSRTLLSSSLFAGVLGNMKQKDTCLTRSRKRWEGKGRGREESRIG